MDNIKVSAYCLVYNHEKYLRSAMEGFVNQKTDFSYEVIVHDDASTDGSAEIIREYAAAYPDIIRPIYQKENQYSKGGRILTNYIFPMMRGKYIAICEGDDYWTDPNKLQLQADFLDTHPEYSGIAHDTIVEEMGKGKTHPMFNRGEDVDISFEQAIEGPSRCWHTSSIMYRREYAVDRPDFFQIAKGIGDYPLVLYLAIKGKVRVLDSIMSHYRYRTENSWSVRVSSSMQRLARTADQLRKMLEEVDRYTDGKYHMAIDKQILKYRYDTALYAEHYAALRKDPLRRIYLQKPLQHRLLTYAKQYFNGLYHLYRRSLAEKK